MQWAGADSFGESRAVALSKGLLIIRDSARAFARTPGLSLVLSLTIALGVGSNVTVFGFVQGLIHPSRAREEERLVSIFAQDKIHAAGPLTRRQFQLLRSHPDAFDWVAPESRLHAHAGDDRNRCRVPGSPRRTSRRDARRRMSGWGHPPPAGRVAIGRHLRFPF